MSCKIHAESYNEVIERNWPEGIKKTRQRMDIFEILYAAEIPISATDIFSEITKKHPDEMYAISTIYRNLLAFEKAGVVTKSVLSTEDTAVYELKNKKHRHYAVCLLCHKKFPINACPLHVIEDDLEASVPGFDITGHNLEVYGYCKDCKEVQS
ncbi:MAG: transcriptional repressor [Butyrivibrio sp.]|nr:transcriptional repressor [Butyrivibrio sp.]